MVFSVGFITLYNHTKDNFTFTNIPIQNLIPLYRNQYTHLKKINTDSHRIITNSAQEENVTKSKRKPMENWRT